MWWSVETILLLFTVKGTEAGLVLAVHHLQTGDIVRQFTAVPLSLLPDEKTTLCIRVCVLGDIVVLSLSQGYPKVSSLSRGAFYASPQ